MPVWCMHLRMLWGFEGLSCARLPGTLLNTILQDYMPLCHAETCNRADRNCVARERLKAAES